MPDDIQKEVTYKVKLDNTDLAQQLQTIRAEIDQALAGQSFGGNSAPSNFSTFSQPVSIPAAFNNSFNSFSNGVSDINSSLNYGFGGFQSSIGTAQQSFNNTMNMMAPKFSSGPEIISRTGGPWSTLMGAYGFGYDPNMPFSRADYQAMAKNNLFYSLPDIAGQTLGGGLGGIVGGALGSIIPGLGTGVGSVLGGAVGTFAGDFAIGGMIRMAAGDIIQDKQASDYINYSLIRRGALGAGQRPGAEAAATMRGYFGTYESFLQGTDRNQFEEILTQFTNQGGFDTARTSEEYMRRFNSLLSDHKKIMHTLRVTQEQAVQFMSELERSNLVGSTGIFSNAASAATTLQGLGTSVGLTGSAVGQFGMQSIGLGLQNIPGMSTGQAFTQGMSSLLSAQSLARQGYYTNDFIARMGGGAQGIQNIAAGLQQSAYSYATTGIGQASLMSPIGADAFDAMAGAVGRLNTWEDLLAFKTGYNTPQLIDRRGIGNINLGRVNQTTEFFRDMGFRGHGVGGKFTMAEAIQQLMLTGVDRNTAEAMVMQGGSKFQTQDEMNISAATEGLRDLAANQPGVMDRFEARAKELGTDVLEGAKRSTLSLLTLGGSEYFWYRYSRPTRERSYENLINGLTNIGRDYTKTYDVGGISYLLEAKKDPEAEALMNQALSKARKPNFRWGMFADAPDDSDVIENLQEQRDSLINKVATKLETLSGDPYYANRIVDTNNLSKRILTGGKVDADILEKFDKQELQRMQLEYKASMAAEGSIGITKDISNYLARINSNYKAGTSVSFSEMEKIAKGATLEQAVGVYSGLSGDAFITRLAYDAALLRDSKDKDISPILESTKKSQELLKAAGLDQSLLSKLQQNIDYTTTDLQVKSSSDTVYAAAMTGDNLERAIFLELRKLNDTFGTLTTVKDGQKYLKTNS